MTAATALSISDIEISSQDAEPRIRDLSLAARLGMADPHKIRSLIEANRDELVTYGVISARQAEIRRRGRPGTEYWLNEGQLLVICALSRAPEAPAIRREIITVFLAHRHNQILAQHEALFAAPAPRVTIVREHQRRVSTSRDTLNSMAKLVDRLAAYVDRLPHDAPPLITAPPPDIKHGQAHIELNGEILTIDTRVGSLTPGVDALVAVGASLDIVRLLRPYESAIWPGTLTRTWFFRRPEFNSEVKVTAIGRLISRRPMPVER